jgi:hypothetical protein
MKMKLATAIALTLMAFPASSRADVINLYFVGSNPAGHALDPVDVNIGGVPILAWDHVSSVAAGPGVTAILSIRAEGIDGGAGAPAGGENDRVFFNGTLVGELTRQIFFAAVFNLQPGPGALPGISANTLSLFDVSALLLAGVNHVEVHVDAPFWVNEIEVSRLTVETLPEPSSVVLLGGGLAIGLVRRRTRSI